MFFLRRFALILLLSFSFLQSAAFAEANVSLLETPGKSAQARFDIATQAKDSLHLSTYILSENLSGFTNAAILRNAALEGKDVRLLVDHFAAGHGPSRALLKSLIQSGVHVGLYHTPQISNPLRYTRRLHDKLLIVDGEHLITGDRNLSDEYFGVEERAWKGMDIYVNDRSMGTKADTYFKELFDSHHVVKPHFPFISKKKVQEKEKGMELAMRAISQMPIVQNESLKFKWAKEGTIKADQVDFLHYPVSEIESRHRLPLKVIKAIDATMKEITIVTPYMVPPPELVKALDQVIQRGGKVRIITNAKETNNQRLAQIYYESTFRDLVKKNYEIYEYQGPETLHAKILVRDQDTVGIGSLNADGISFKKNTESGVLVKSAAFKEKVSTALNEDFIRNAKLVARDGQSFVGDRKCHMILSKMMRLLRDHL